MRLALSSIIFLFAAACFDDTALDQRRCAVATDCEAPAQCMSGFCVLPFVPGDASVEDARGDATVTDNGGVDANIDAGLDAGPMDAPDSGIVSCTPNAAYCDADGRTLHTCDSMGTGNVAGADVVCGYLCEVDACRYASNVSDAIFGACNAQAPPLEPPSFANLTFESGDVHCSPHCGDGVTTQISGSGSPSIACVSSLAIASTVNVEANGGPAIILIVAGDALIDSTVDLRSKEGGAPGGFSGGAPGGHMGNGPGGGGAGDNDTAGSGGGGGGFGGNGGRGGDGFTGTGGTAGAIGGNEELIPLIGGSGGGSGRARGGQGGAGFQISARGTLTLSGRIRANGARGDNGMGGSGGGGSGGAILLEAKSYVFMNGPLEVRGGSGGDSIGGGNGGGGASGSTSDGMQAMTSTIGGGGGGGAAGRVRINAINGAVCNDIDPSNACTTGSLRTTP